MIHQVQLGLDYLRHSGPVTVGLGFVILFSLGLLVISGTALAIQTSPPHLATACPPQAINFGYSLNISSSSSQVAIAGGTLRHLINNW